MKFTKYELRLMKLAIMCYRDYSIDRDDESIADDIYDKLEEAGYTLDLRDAHEDTE